MSPWRDKKNMLNDRLKVLVYWFCLVIFSAVACIYIVFFVPKSSIAGWIVAGLGYLIAVLLAILLLDRVILRYTRKALHAYSLWEKVSLLVVCLLCGAWLSLNIPIPSPQYTESTIAPTIILKLVYRTSLGMVIGLTIFLIIVWLAGAIRYQPQVSSPNSLIRASIKYSIPTGITWVIYLLVYFPGMMSADSMDQWNQILTGQFVDHHPAFHTFLEWLVTRIYLSPVSIAVAQIIALAFVAGLWFAFLESLGTRRWIIWSIALIFAITPVNGTMVNTLWKDVPFSTAVLALTLILVRIAVSKGKWITPLPAQIILGVIAALTLLIRKDGLTVGVGTLLILFVAYPHRWKSWLVSGLICAFLYFGIRGPVYRWVGVAKSNTLLESSLSPYTLAAYAIRGSEADLLVSSINLLSPKWNCDIWSEIDPNGTNLDKSISPVQAGVNLLHHLPSLLMYDARCSRSLEWVIWDPYGEVRNTSHTEVLVDPNPFGIKADSKIPILRTWISNWVYHTSHDTNINWFIWRPALFLYLNLLAAAILIIRNHDLRFGLLSVPILIQSVTFSLIIAAPNFRYHYAVYLVSLISIALAFSPSITKNINPGTIDPGNSNGKASAFK